MVWKNQSSPPMEPVATGGRMRPGWNPALQNADAVRGRLTRVSVRPGWNPALQDADKMARLFPWRDDLRVVRGRLTRVFVRPGWNPALQNADQMACRFPWRDDLRVVRGRLTRVSMRPGWNPALQDAGKVEGIPHGAGGAARRCCQPLGGLKARCGRAGSKRVAGFMKSEKKGMASGRISPRAM